MGNEQEPTGEPDESSEDSREEDLSYLPLFELDSGHPELVRGAEIGAVNTRLMLLHDEAVEQLMHRSNEEMVRRIANAHGREYTSEFLDETYMVVRFDVPTLPNVMDAIYHRPE